MLLDYHRIRQEIKLRLELLKINPNLLAKIDEESRRKGENCLAALLGPDGSIQRNADGSLELFVPRTVQQTAKLREVAAVSRNATTTTRHRVPPSDYPKLLQANKQRTWTISMEWNRIYRDLVRYVERNNGPQTALAASKLAALELNIPAPQVRVWRGDERQAEKKAGWVCSSNANEINIVLAQPCKLMAITSAHECKHIEQFVRFPNLTAEERESDAAEFEKEFALYVLHEAPAAWLARLH
jgi:hypothetical protein